MNCDLCGKLKAKLNDTNWARHIEACKNKKRKLKRFQDIASFFSPNIEVRIYLLQYLNLISLTV